MSNISQEMSENITFALRSLYDKYGYSRYKMNKFEEYDLYARNKDFLISDGVITFTDTNGKLMALKPDVTLSIVKNTKDRSDRVQKLYYNENVYRVSKGTHSFKEIMQVGLEAIGNVDDYCIYEVLNLAAESLRATGMNCILEVSHLGLLSDTLNFVGIPFEAKGDVLHFIGEKNLHQLQSICHSLGIPDEKTALLSALASIYGTPEEVLPEISKLLRGVANADTLSQFEKIVSSLNNGSNKAMFRIDFSVVNDLRYYNGFVFKGFAEGVPTGVLSGGQYDTMMKKMKRSSGAIGFAVYLDTLEQFGSSADEYDVDNLLLYGDETDISSIEKLVAEITGGGESVLVERAIPSDVKYKKLIRLDGRGE